MKIWTSEHVFNHPWETVAQAAWRKYPNPMNPAVVGVDVLDRKVVNGVLHTHRLISSQWGIPDWAQMLIGSSRVCYASEYSTVSPEQRKMVLTSRNLTFCKYIAVDEKLSYLPHPEDPQRTLLQQEAVVTVQGVPLTSYMENILTSAISSNAGKGRQALEWVIDKINTEVQELTQSAMRSTDELLNSAVKSTDEFLTQTRKSVDDITVTAKKSMDELSSVASAAIKSIDNLQNLANHPTRKNSIPNTDC